MSEILGLRPLLAAAMLIASAGLVFAAPANAGCESQPTHQYCDLPKRPDGSWDRCRIIFGTGFNFEGIGNSRHGQLRCYPINPSRVPFGEPQHYIP